MTFPIGHETDGIPPTRAHSPTIGTRRCQGVETTSGRQTYRCNHRRLAANARRRPRPTLSNLSAHAGVDRHLGRRRERPRAPSAHVRAEAAALERQLSRRIVHPVPLPPPQPRAHATTLPSSPETARATHRVNTGSARARTARFRAAQAHARGVDLRTRALCTRSALQGPTGLACKVHTHAHGAATRFDRSEARCTGATGCASTPTDLVRHNWRRAAAEALRAAPRGGRSVGAQLATPRRARRAERRAQAGHWRYKCASIIQLAKIEPRATSAPRVAGVALP